VTGEVEQSATTKLRSSASGLATVAWLRDHGGPAPPGGQRLRGESQVGRAVLCNSALLDDGGSKGLAPEDVPDEPDELLYVGLTRATTELVVIAPPALVGRMG
jgi:hypothetical protein